MAPHQGMMQGHAGGREPASSDCNAGACESRYCEIDALVRHAALYERACIRL